jgi:hypothetical protein
MWVAPETSGISWFEVCALLGYYAAPNGNHLPTFRDNLSVPSSSVEKLLLFLDFLAIENETDVLSRNVGKAIINKLTPVATIIVMKSLITLYYYLEISYSRFIILNAEPKWNLQSHKNKTTKHIRSIVQISQKNADLSIAAKAWNRGFRDLVVSYFFLSSDMVIREMSRTA